MLITQAFATSLIKVLLVIHRGWPRARRKIEAVACGVCACTWVRAENPTQQRLAACHNTAWRRVTWIRSFPDGKSSLHHLRWHRLFDYRHKQLWNAKHWGTLGKYGVPAKETANPTSMATSVTGSPSFRVTYLQKGIRGHMVIKAIQVWKR